MPRFDLADIASKYNALSLQVADSKKPCHSLVSMKRLDLLVATHFGELLQHAERQQLFLDEADTRYRELKAENEDLQAQLLAAQGGLDETPARPPVAEAAGDVDNVEATPWPDESPDPNTPENARHAPD